MTDLFFPTVDSIRDPRLGLADPTASSSSSPSSSAGQVMSCCGRLNHYVYNNYMLLCMSIMLAAVAGVLENDNNLPQEIYTDSEGRWVYGGGSSS